jgi:serine/threonine protein kinase
VKITDFDVATQVSGMQSMCRTCVGTPHYIAPEVVLEESSSYAQDIRSVGCCTLELATGHLPFHECQGIQVMHRMVEEEHPPLPDTGITDELHDFLKICWAKDPKQRPAAKDLIKTTPGWQGTAGRKGPTSRVRRHGASSEQPGGGKGKALRPGLANS